MHEALWITVASVLAALDISRAKDDKGREIIPAEEYSYGFMWCVFRSGLKCMENDCFV